MPFLVFQKDKTPTKVRNIPKNDKKRYSNPFCFVKKQSECPFKSVQLHHYSPNFIRALSVSVFCFIFCLKELKLYDIPSQSIRLLFRLLFLSSKRLLCDHTSQLAVFKTSVISKEVVIVPFKKDCFTPIFIWCVKEVVNCG